MRPEVESRAVKSWRLICGGEGGMRVRQSTAMVLIESREKRVTWVVTVGHRFSAKIGYGIWNSRREIC
eukprot:scaffold93778_cov40-Cyclotella_meneghiniana.AAC.3